MLWAPRSKESQTLDRCSVAGTHLSHRTSSISDHTRDSLWYSKAGFPSTTLLSQPPITTIIVSTAVRRTLPDDSHEYLHY